MFTELAVLFADPTPVYRPMMFWVWNGEITREAIDRDIGEMKAKGCGGFFIHPMGESFRLRDFAQGQSPPYLSPAYFELVRYAVQRAAEEGLYAWLYDEGGWPSGTAQGAVVEGRPELAGKVLRLRPEGHPVEGEVISAQTAGGEGVRFVMEHGGFPVDMLNPATVGRFIEVTHERYRESVGEYFGTTVPGMFTDEPRVGGRVGTGEIPWTPRMLQEFGRDHGYDLRPHLPLLFEGAPEGDPARAAVRCAFYDTWTRLYREAYWDPINAWCRENRLLHVGHVGGEDTLPDHVNGGFGEFFRTAGTLDVPGVDAIWRQIWPTGPRLHYPLLASSAAHQQAPREPLGDWPATGLALTESFGVYGFGLTFAGMKWVTDYQYVRGVNVMCPMALSLCTAGGRLYRTQDFMGPGNPLWAYYGRYADYVGRLSVLTRAGSSAATVAVYYPVETLWAGEAGETPGSFEAACGVLEERQVQADILGGDALLAAAIEEQLLCTPGAAYELVIVPEMRVMRKAVAQKLAEFRERGGRVAFLGEGPEWIVDGPVARPTAEVVPGLLRDALAVEIPKDLDGLVAAFGGQPGRSMALELDGFSAAYFGGPWVRRFAGRRLAPGVALTVSRENLGPFAELLGRTPLHVHLGLDDPVGGLRVLTRVLEHGSIHLLVNERDQEISLDCLFSADEPLVIEAWDPEDGSRTSLATHQELSEATPFGLVLRPNRALFVVARPEGSLAAPPDRELPEVARVLGSLRGPAPLQGWEVREGDVTALSVLPAPSAAETPTEEGRWDLIPGCEHFSGTMEYRLAFTADADWADDPCVIELSRVQYVAEAWLNRQPLGSHAWAPYRWDATGLIRAGQNELVVRVSNTLANACLRPEAVAEAKAHGWWNVYCERATPMMEESLPSGVDPLVTVWVSGE